MIAAIAIAHSLALIADPASTVTQTAPSSPTSSTAAQSDETFDSLQRKAGVSIRLDGGPASMKGISIRGSTSKEVGIFFEGIRLNSMASGEFDLGLLSPLGLSKAVAIKGGHHGYSASPQGALFLGLPDQEASESKLFFGSYGSLGIFQRIPGASISIDQSNNDYPYILNGQEFTRQNNSHQRINLRLWKRWKNSQVWAQVLTNDLELPGPVTASFTPSRSMTVRPMIAGQYRWGKTEANIFANYQRQSVDSSDNHYWGAASRINHRIGFLKKWAAEVSLEESFDFISTPFFDSPFRSMTLGTFSLLWSPNDRWLINPQIQTEFVSDLNSPFAISGGIGTRWNLHSDFYLTSHMNYVSRVPNFNEMYFEIPPSFLGNDRLEREPSLQFDFGYEWNWKALRLNQSIYGIRTNKTISSIYSAGTYQAQNLGAGARLGVETDIQISISRNFQIEGSYQFLIARLSDTRTNMFDFSVIQENSRQFYQPTHKAALNSKWALGQLLEISLPFYYRSKVRASLNNDEVPRQFDLGLILETKPQQKFPLSVQLRADNLLSWNREETFGYPLGSEPNLKLSLSHLWN